MATWDAATKAHALDLLQDGTTLADTHRTTGVPKPTLSDWARKAGLRTAERSTAKTQAATEAKRAQWAELREDVANHAGQTAQRILALVDQALDSGELEVRSVSQAKDAATTMAILADKAQLLSGDATTRSDHLGLRAQVLEQAQQSAPKLRAVS